MSQGSVGPCRHVWQTTCRNCGTNFKDWPELRSALVERLELTAQALHAAHILSGEAAVRDAIAVLAGARDKP